MNQAKTFTVFGFIILAVLFLMMASGRYSKAIVMFLAITLLSMILINWTKIEPLLLRRAQG